MIQADGISTNVDAEAEGPVRSPRVSARRVLGSFRDFERTLSLLIIGAWAFVIVFAPYLGLADPLHQDVVNRLLPPNPDHWFGTDQLGRDLLSRVLYGGRASVPAAVLVVAVGFPLGTMVGAIGGYAGHKSEEVIMRVTDMFLAFPVLVLAMAVAAALGASLFHGAIALAVVWWPAYVRVTRGMVLDIKN